MAELKASQRLKKQLGLLDVYAIATGSTLSAGFFLLPGLAAVQAGPAIVLAYALAIIPLLPALACKAELGTAMPRAGGVYFYLDRTMGPAIGTIGGFGTWLVLVLKVSFALVGLGAYLHLFLPNVPLTPIVVGIALLLGALNILGSKSAGGFQIFLVVGLLAILAAFIAGGATRIQTAPFENFFEEGIDSIFSTAGFVYISYIGITKVASLSEEIKDPEKNLPKGIFLAMITAVVVYVLGTAVMVMVVPMEQLKGDYTPVATTAQIILGDWGVSIVVVAALLAFTSVANAGILSASRYPLAMSRDHLIPRAFAKLGFRNNPTTSVTVTVALIIAFLITIDPVKIAKLASSFQLVMFAMVCFAVLVMRESGIESYDPAYKAPWYPWTPIIGIVAPIFFIFQMGWESILFSVGLVVSSILWYRFYGKSRASRDGAIFHVFERWGQQRDKNLDRELRGIMKEKGLREEDPFDEVVARSYVIDAEKENFEQLVKLASANLAGRVPLDAEELESRFLQGTLIGATPVTHGVALPHLRVVGVEHPELVLVRVRLGVTIHLSSPLQKRESDQEVKAIFFLVSPDADPTRHLRMLAQIAGSVDKDTFDDAWKAARDEAEIKEVLLRDERYRNIIVDTEGKSADLIGKPLKDIVIPDGALIALIKRADETVIPRGHTVLQDGDRLTIIGTSKGVDEFHRRYD